MIKRIADMASAIHSLAPGSQWIYENDDYETIVWLSDDIEQPTYEEVSNEILRLQQEIDNEIALANEQQLAKEAAKESALVKLAALGLTEEEAKAIVGV